MRHGRRAELPDVPVDSLDGFAGGLTVELLGETKTVTTGADGSFLTEFELRENEGLTA